MLIQFKFGHSQKVPKFELHKHNDELFNIYCGIFYELWTFVDFDRLCKLEKGDHLRIISAKFGWNWLSSFRGEDFFLISSPLFSNLHNRSKSAKVQSSKRGDEIKKKSSPLKLLSQFQPNFAEMILRWSPFKIVSISAALYPRWPPLLKIEISSNGKNCSI
jgi:hypothetical protein